MQRCRRVNVATVSVWLIFWQALEIDDKNAQLCDHVSALNEYFHSASGKAALAALFAAASATKEAKATSAPAWNPFNVAERVYQWPSHTRTVCRALGIAGITFAICCHSLCDGFVHFFPDLRELEGRAF